MTPLKTTGDSEHLVPNLGRGDTKPDVGPLSEIEIGTQSAVKLCERRCAAVGSREEFERGDDGSGVQREDF